MFDGYAMIVFFRFDLWICTINIIYLIASIVKISLPIYATNNVYQDCGDVLKVIRPMRKTGCLNKAVRFVNQK